MVIANLNIRPETIKLPEEDIYNMFLGTGLDNIFLDVSSGKGNKSK